MDAVKEAVDAPCGVSLARYASVKAAVMEPFPLEEALSAYGVDAGAWPQVDLAWTALLIDHQAGAGGLFDAFRDELAAAEDRLVRRVTPLDDELAAWVGFLCAFSAPGAGLALLQQAGLGMNDVSRLSRRWSLRLEQDATLKRRAAELLKAPGPMPSILAAPRALPRGRVATPVQAADPSSADTADAAGLDRYAALRAELAAFPGETARALRKHGLTDEASQRALDDLWGARFASDPSLARDYRALHAHASAQLARARATPTASPEGQIETAPAPLPPVVAALPDPSGAGTTMDVSAFLESGPALPFATGPAPALARAVAHAADVGGPPPAASDAGGTMDVGAFFESGSVLPFPSKPAEPVAATTMDVSSFLESGPALPFALSPTAPSPAPTSAPAPAADAGATVDVGAFFESGAALPFLAKPAEPAAGTMDVGAFWESGPALPFAAERAAPSQALAGASVQVAGVQGTAPAGGTMDVGALFESGSALPFMTTPAEEPPAPTPATSAAPALDLQAYASLCVELHRYPARRSETLARYHLSPEAGSALDAGWRARIVGDPLLQSAFASAYTRYAAWLSAHPERPREAVIELSIEQYASLCVELSLDATRAGETLQRYGLDAGRRAELDAVWGGRFAARPADRVAFDQACAAYRVWLLSRAR